MASSRVEKDHKLMLDKLLSTSGLECIRSAPESEQSSSLSEELEEAVVEEEASVVQEEAVEEEKYEYKEEIAEELPDIFPTPSLRRAIPDRLRKIEAINRIHVLPENFRTDIDPEAIPKIAQTAPQRYIDILAEIVGCTEYKSSLAEFWFLDTLANLLRRAQEDKLDKPTQAVLIQWFCEWMKEMQQFDAASRPRMLRRFKDNMIAAAKFISEEERLPTPQEAGVYYKEEPAASIKKSSERTSEMMKVVAFEGVSYECSLTDLTKIIHYIYDLFSTDYQYDLVRSIFTFSPEYVLIDALHQIQTPKRLYGPAKGKKEKGGGQKEKGKEKKDKKDKKSKEAPDTAEFLHLMAVKKEEQKELDAKEELEREEYTRKTRILPLSYAATEEFFNKYWPPPPPAPVSPPEVVKEDKAKSAKGKGKGKK